MGDGTSTIWVRIRIRTRTITIMLSQNLGTQYYKRAVVVHSCRYSWLVNTEIMDFIVVMKMNKLTGSYIFL